jgi:hypothetical protein
MRLALAALAVFLLAGCGGGRHPALRLDVTVISGLGAERHSASFRLECGPAGGSLPYAHRLCGDVAAHRRAMIHPLPARSLCTGRLGGPTVTVKVSDGGRTSRFDGEPFCDWPGGTPLAVYWAAASHDTKTLALAEAKLRCDDDPVLLARPTHWARVRACLTHPSPPAWLVRAERMLLARTFGGARPQRVDYIPYPEKIAVVFAFGRVVVCGACSAPSAASEPRGRVVRVSFDRSTHALGGAPDGWAMQFCSERNRARCFHL